MQRTPPVIVPFFIAHQGCPHRCVFCDQTKIAGAAESIPDAEEILNKVGMYRLHAKGRPLQAAFYGGSFTSLPPGTVRKLLGVLEPLIEEGTVTSVRISTRPDAVDEKITDILAASGVSVVEIGVQSMDDSVLSRSGRGHTSDHTERAIGILLEKGMVVGAQLMPGLPEETKESSIRSLEKVLAMGVHFLRIYPALVIAGSEMEQMYLRREYIPLDLDGAVRLCAMLLQKCMSAGVPVTRMGLQPTEELDAPGAVVAGPYHPAFRQLAEGELFYNALATMAPACTGADIDLFCSPGRISETVGQGRRNLLRLQKRHGLRVRSVKPDPLLGPTELKVVSGNTETIGSVIHIPFVN